MTMLWQKCPWCPLFVRSATFNRSVRNNPFGPRQGSVPWPGTSVALAGSALLSSRAWRSTSAHTHRAHRRPPLSASCARWNSACCLSTGPTPASTTVTKRHPMVTSRTRLTRRTLMGATLRHHLRASSARGAPKSLPRHFHESGTISVSMPPRPVLRNATMSRTTRSAAAWWLREQCGSTATRGAPVQTGARWGTSRPECIASSSVCPLPTRSCTI